MQVGIIDQNASERTNTCKIKGNCINIEYSKLFHLIDHNPTVIHNHNTDCNLAAAFAAAATAEAAAAAAAAVAAGVVAVVAAAATNTICSYR